MVWYEKTALVLAAIGAINWGLAELNFNLVEKLLGTGTITTVVYYIVAICGIFALVKAFSR